ncbi:TPA: DUF551 domain-containing protein [Klebsiella pneumoniae]
MTKSTIARERLEWLSQISCRDDIEDIGGDEIRELASMALAAMDSSESVQLPLDYLQGHKDGLEWAARLAEANHPETGYWLYDDPIELAKAIRKGPDMPPAQPVADSEPVAWLLSGGGTKNVVCFDSGNAYADPLREVTPLYRYPQPAPEYPETLPCPVLLEPGMRFGKGVKTRLVLDAIQRRAEQYAELEAMTQEERAEHDANIEAFKAMLPQPVPVAYSDFESFWSSYIHPLAQDDELKGFAWDIWCAAMLAAAPQSPGSEPATVPGKWIPVSERMPENDGAYLCWDNRYVTTYAFIFGAWQANQFIAKKITHWMPLPAGPQEVNRE